MITMGVKYIFPASAGRSEGSNNISAAGAVYRELYIRKNAGNYIKKSPKSVLTVQKVENLDGSVGEKSKFFLIFSENRKSKVEITRITYEIPPTR